MYVEYRKKWEHLIYFIGEFRVKLRFDFFLVFAQYFVLLLLFFPPDYRFMFLHDTNRHKNDLY